MTNENNNLNPQEIPPDIGNEPIMDIKTADDTPTGGFLPQSSPSPQKKKNLPILIGVILVAVALIAFGASKLLGSQITKDPVGHVLLAAMNTSKEKAMSSTMIMSGQINEADPQALETLSSLSGDTAALAKYINALAGNFRLRMDSNTVYSEEELFHADMDLKIQYGDKEFVRFLGSLSPWTFVFKSDDLYSKPFYFDLGKFTENEIGFNLSEIDFAGYVKILSEEDELLKKVESNSKVYEETIREFLKDKIEPLPKGHKITVYEEGQEKTIDGYGYKYTGSLDSIYELYALVLEKAKSDENVKALLLDRMNKVVDKAVADKDYEKFGATEDEFTSVAKEAIAELETNYESKLDEAITQIRNTASQLNSLMTSQGEVSYDMVLSIDKDHRLRRYDFHYAISPMILSQSITYNKFGSDVKPNIMEASAESVDLYELINQPQPPTEMIEEVADNLTENVLSGEAMEALLQDAQDKKELLPADERDALANGVGQAVDQMKGAIAFMKMMFVGTGTP